MNVAVDLNHALAVARDAAAAAADIITHYWHHDVNVERKADDTPVTVADREAESAIRGTLLAAFPDHAIYGEEQGRRGDSEALWLVDPLDGTRSFVRRTPFFSTQIALMLRGKLVLGVSTAPIYGETLWATRGGGAFADGEPVHVAATDALNRTSLSIGNVKTLTRGPGWARLGSLIQQVERCRGLGDFLHYHLLAQGALDAIVESDVNILDIAALAVIVREAGGTFTDLTGRELDLATTSVLAATPALHPVLLQHFN